MASGLDKMKKNHQFEDSNYFWREKTQDVDLEVEDFWILFFTQKTYRITKEQNRHNK